MLQRMLERVLAAGRLDEVVVATTSAPIDAPIRELCRRLDVPCFSGHPTDLLDRHVQAARLFGADVVLKIPSDCPLIDPRIVDRVLQAWALYYLFLSKGHDVPALYGTLAERGYFPRERLARHLKLDDSIYWHPNPAVPGIEFHSGSPGHLLSVGIGVALDIRMQIAFFVVTHDLYIYWFHRLQHRVPFL